jgi:hypothetical protein
MMSSIHKQIAARSAIPLIAFFTGCASIARGTKDTHIVETEAAGADVHLSLA